MGYVFVEYALHSGVEPSLQTWNGKFEAEELEELEMRLRTEDLGWLYPN